MSEITLSSDIVSEDVAVDTSGMTDSEKRLFALRMKINQSRKANKEEVEKEYKRLTDPAYESKIHLAEAYEQRMKDGTNIKKKSDSLLNETAVR
jgi:hypothetical protein